MKDKLDKATSRFLILYERGQNTKKECMKCLSEIYDIDDEAYLRTVYNSVLNILEHQKTEWIEMTEEIANINLNDLPAFISTLDSLLEISSLLDNSVVGKYPAGDPPIGEYLFPDVAHLETKLNTDLLLAKKRLWNVPAQEQVKKPEAVGAQPSSLSFDWAKENKDKTALAKFVYLFCPPDDSNIATPFKGKRQDWLTSLEAAINNTPNQSRQDAQAQAKELRARGHGIKDIANALDVSPRTVIRWLGMS